MDHLVVNVHVNNAVSASVTYAAAHSGWPSTSATMRVYYAAGTNMFGRFLPVFTPYWYYDCASVAV